MRSAPWLGLDILLAMSRAQPPGALPARQRSEQYFTSSQTLAHFFRHAKGRPQLAQVFSGSSAFLRIFAITSPARAHEPSGSRIAYPPDDLRSVLPFRICRMSALRLVLGDQLTRDLSALDGLDPARDVILMAEVHDETIYVPHHKQKIALILSAMRHFAEELRAEGLAVDYVSWTIPATPVPSPARSRARWRGTRPTASWSTEPGEWRVLEMMREWRRTLGVRSRSATTTASSARAVASRAGRRTGAILPHGVLLPRDAPRDRPADGGDEPVGGRWNFDHENRKRLPPAVDGRRAALRFEPDADHARGDRPGRRSASPTISAISTASAGR